MAQSNPQPLTGGLFMFEVKKVPGGQATPCAGITCGTCPTTEWHAAPEASWGNRIFKSKGWSIGNRVGRHRCPECVGREAALRYLAEAESQPAAPVTQEETALAAAFSKATEQTIANNPDPRPFVSQPALAEKIVAMTSDIRQPSLADRRRIRESVEEHYDEDKQRWDGDMTDAGLAHKLDVPRQWVTMVREMYGPDVNDSERTMHEAQTIRTRQRIQEAETLALNAKHMCETIFELSAKLETTMAALEIKRREIGL